jgi:hypothetical protein
VSSVATVRRAAVLAVVTLLAASAVGFTSGGAGAQGDVQKSTITVQLTSNQTVLEEVGRGGDTTYGWNLLTGEAGTDSGDVSVTLLGNVEYTDGQGPFFGFLTLKYASLSTLGLRIVTGEATKQPDGSTDFTAKLKVIDGTAAMTGAKGGGSFTGSRAAALGSPIEITIKLRLRLS